MPANLCEHCTGMCCRYIALPIETPRTPKDFDDMRWYLLHEGVSIFQEAGDWYINIQTVCRHLQPDYRCGIYATRPRICRSYSTDNCDYHSGDYGWQEHFTCPEHLEEYILRMRAARRERRKGARGRRVVSRSRNGRTPGRRLQHMHTQRGGRGPTRPMPFARLIQAGTDIRGVPLPVLPAGAWPIDPPAEVSPSANGQEPAGKDRGGQGVNARSIGAPGNMRSRNVGQGANGEAGPHSRRVIPQAAGRRTVDARAPRGKR